MNFIINYVDENGKKRGHGFTENNQEKGICKAIDYVEEKLIGGCTQIDAMIDNEIFYSRG